MADEVTLKGNHWFFTRGQRKKFELVASPDTLSAFLHIKPGSRVEGQQGGRRSNTSILISLFKTIYHLLVGMPMHDSEMTSRNASLFFIYILDKFAHRVNYCQAEGNFVKPYLPYLGLHIFPKVKEAQNETVHSIWHHFLCSCHAFPLGIIHFVLCVNYSFCSNLSDSCSAFE